MASTNTQELIRTALDEFESASLSASLRRASRIARLRGDVEDAWRFSKDLSPVGGDQAINAKESADLWPTLEYDEMRLAHAILLEGFIKERTPYNADPKILAEDSVLGGSVDEIERGSKGLEQEASAARSAGGPNALELALMLEQEAGYRLEILTRIRHRVFTYLCKCETTDRYEEVVTSVWERHRRRVEKVLSTMAPEVLEQFTSAYKRTVEGDAESLRHALSSCRNILEVVADKVYPAQDTPLRLEDGTVVKLGHNEYVNRLTQFVKETTGSKSAAHLTTYDLADFHRRVTSLVEVTSKGIHSAINSEYVDLCVVHVYLIVGEILRLHAGEEP